MAKLSVRLFRSKRGDIWISLVLYLLIMVSTTLLILNAGIPLLNSLKDKSVFSKTEDTLLGINQHIRDVADEGQGSQRVVSITVKSGDFKVGADKIAWEMESSTKLVEPRTTIDKGDLKIKANSDVSASESSLFTLSNSRLIANFTKIGNSTHWALYNTSSIIRSITFKQENENVAGNFSFSLGSQASSGTGTGYTYLRESGDGLGSASLISHMNASKYEYDLRFTLESEADFLRIEVENLKVK